MYLSRYNEVFAEENDDKVAHVLSLAYVKTRFRLQGDKYVKRLDELDLIEANRAAGRVLLLSVVDLQSATSTLPVNDSQTMWIDCLREGSWLHPEHGNITVTLTDLKRIKENFDRKVIGRDPHLDYGHFSYSPIDDDDLKAAGWFKKLELREVSTPSSVKRDGTIVSSPMWHLFAMVEMTPKALDAVRTREFRYISPTFNMKYVSKDSGKDVGPTLEAAALTNTPFLTGLAPIVASEPVMCSEVLKQRVEPAGGPVNELIQLIKTQSLKFSDMVQKLTAAGIDKAREVAATLYMSAAGVDVSKPIALAEVEKHVPELAAELKTASKTDFTGLVLASEQVGKVTAALTVTVAPPTKEHVKPETPDVKMLSERVSMLERELEQGRAARVEFMLSELGKKNDAGLAFAPAFVSKVKVMLGAKPNAAGLTVNLSEPMKLSESQTAQSHAEAFLLLLAEVRDGKALVRLNKVTKDESKKTTGTGIAVHLSYTPQTIPAETVAAYRKEFGSNVSRRSIFLSELAKSVQAKAEEAKTPMSLSESQVKADAMMLSEFGPVTQSEESEDEED
jgi:hypothetical protein